MAAGGHTEVKMGSERGFAQVFAVVFVIIGAWPLWDGAAPRYWLFGVAAAILALGYFAPSILRPLNWVWFKFGMLLGAVVAPLVMALVFFVVVTPMALIAKLVGKDPLRRRREPDADSYWIRRDSAPGPMRNQF